MNMETTMNGKALVVDDDLIIRQLVATVLKKCFPQVVTASSGEQALALLDRRDFSLVVTDLQMGRIDGLDVVRQAKKKKAGTVVIMMSGSGLQQSRTNALRAGVDAYLEKPFPVVQLLERIGRSPAPMPAGCGDALACLL